MSSFVTLHCCNVVTTRYWFLMSVIDGATIRGSRGNITTGKSFIYLSPGVARTCRRTVRVPVHGGLIFFSDIKSYTSCITIVADKFVIIILVSQKPQISLFIGFQDWHLTYSKSAPLSYAAVSTNYLWDDKVTY